MLGAALLLQVSFAPKAPKARRMHVSAKKCPHEKAPANLVEDCDLLALPIPVEKLSPTWSEQSACMLLDLSAGVLYEQAFWLQSACSPNFPSTAHVLVYHSLSMFIVTMSLWTECMECMRPDFNFVACF